MHCTKCGSDMRRLMRESFLQRKVYPLFGFYPWECPLCRVPVLLKKRHLRRKRSRQTDFSAYEASLAKSSNQQVTPAMPVAKTR
jgi:hypothetical protein